MLNFHSSAKKAAFNAVYVGDLSELRLEVKTLSLFSQHPHKSWFLCLSAKSCSPHEKGTKHMKRYD